MFRNTFCQILPPWSMNVQKFLPSMRNLKLLGWFCLRILLKCLATRTMRGKERIFCTDVDLARKSRFFHSPLQGFRNSVPFSRDEKPFSLDSMILPICDTRFFGLKLSLGFIEQNTNLPTHKRRWTDVNKIFLHLVWVFCFICHSQTNPRADNYGSTDPFSTNSCRTFLVLCNFCSWINKQSRKCSADVKTDSHFIF